MVSCMDRRLLLSERESPKRGTLNRSSITGPLLPSPRGKSWKHNVSGAPLLPSSPASAGLALMLVKCEPRYGLWPAPPCLRLQDAGPAAVLGPPCIRRLDGVVDGGGPQGRTS